MRVEGQRKRLDIYIEPELYEWIHQQASRQERSMSGWMRYVVVQLRNGLQPATLEAGVAHDDDQP